MSVTTRTLTSSVDLGHRIVASGSVNGSTTKVSFVFTSDNPLFGIESPGSMYVYVDGVRKSLSWTVNKTEVWVNKTFITKMSSAVLTVTKPFFQLKIVDSDDVTHYDKDFSFYDIEKAATSATAKGGVMDGSTASTVTFTTSSTDATYKAVFSLGTYSGSATSSTKTVSYKIPITWCNALPNKTSGTISVSCQVLFGGSVYKTINCSLSASVPASVVPTVSSVTLADKTDTPVPSTWKVFVQHQSGLRISAVTCAGAYSSTIKTIKLQVGNQTKTMTYSPSDLPQIDTITQSGSLSCTVTVTDSRGRTGQKTATVTFLPYAAPSFPLIQSDRCTATGELDNDGTYFLSTSQVEYSSCNGKNSFTLKFQYKRTDSVVYNDLVTITPGTNICGDGNLSTEYSYDVRYVILDQFSTVSYIDYVSTAVYLMHFLHGGRGVAFGQKATTPDYLDCNFKALFRDDVYVTLDDGRRFNLRNLLGGAISTLLSNVSANRAIVSNADGKLCVSAVSDTELGYLDGVSSNVQIQLNGKQEKLEDYGWKEVVLSSAFEAYNSSYTPRYRRIGDIVTVVGAVKPKSEIEGSGTAVTIFTLPEGYRPKVNTVTVCQGSGAAEWTFTLSTAGVGSFSRHRSAGSTGYVNTATTAWLPFHVTFIRA